MCHARSDLGALSKIVGEKEKKVTKIIEIRKKPRTLHSPISSSNSFGKRTLARTENRTELQCIYARQLLSSPRSPVGFLA